MYADKITGSMKNAIEETRSRRILQEAYNAENGITPQGIKKTVRDITERLKIVVESHSKTISEGELPREELILLIKDLESQMKLASRNLEFENAALLRDQIVDLRKVL